MSLLERLVGLYGGRVTRRLDVQYRMNEAIMAFSSAEFYEGTLLADASGHDRRALRRRRVVRLEPKARESQLSAALGELDIADPALGEVRGDVYVGIEAVADERPRVLGWNRMLGRQGSILTARILTLPR